MKVQFLTWRNPPWLLQRHAFEHAVLELALFPPDSLISFSQRRLKSRHMANPPSQMDPEEVSWFYLHRDTSLVH